MARRWTRGLLAIGALAVMAGAAGLAAELAQERREIRTKAATLTGGDPEAGRGAVKRYGCGGCHAIPGVTAARGRVGPPLAGFASRAYIGGVAVNTPQHLVEWIKDPKAFDPRTAMPNVGATHADARDMAAYLYTLD